MVLDEQDEYAIKQKLLLSWLPDLGTQYWTAQRKAKVVEAVAAGLLTQHEACARYAMSVEERESWITRYRTHGNGWIETATVAPRGALDRPG